MNRLIPRNCRGVTIRDRAALRVAPRAVPLPSRPLVFNTLSLANKYKCGHLKESILSLASEQGTQIEYHATTGNAQREGARRQGEAIRASRGAVARSTERPRLTQRPRTATKASSASPRHCRAPGARWASGSRPERPPRPGSARAAAEGTRDERPAGLTGADRAVAAANSFRRSRRRQPPRSRSAVAGARARCSRCCCRESRGEKPPPGPGRSPGSDSCRAARRWS